MLCSQDVPSAANEIARTIHAAGPPDTVWRALSPAIAMATDKQPPIRNDAIAAMKAQRNRSRAWPRGCVASAGWRSRRSPTARNTSFTESAVECAASASMPVDPETSPAINFAIAITMLARNAMTMVRVLSPSAALRRAVAERRRGRIRKIGQTSGAWQPERRSCFPGSIPFIFRPHRTMSTPESAFERVRALLRLRECLFLRRVLATPEFGVGESDPVRHLDAEGFDVGLPEKLDRKGAAVPVEIAGADGLRAERGLPQELDPVRGRSRRRLPRHEKARHEVVFRQLASLAGNGNDVGPHARVAHPDVDLRRLRGGLLLGPKRL